MTPDKRDTERLTIPDVRERFQAYKDANPTWGSLHIVLDDGNVADHHVDFCIQWALDHNDLEGVVLGRMLRRMSRTQRLKLAAVVR